MVVSLPSRPAGSTVLLPAQTIEICEELTDLLENGRHKYYYRFTTRTTIYYAMLLIYDVA